MIHEGNRLQHWIERSPLSKKKIMNQLGIKTYSGIGHYVKQERISLKILNKFCEVMGITIDQFYEGPDGKVTETTVTSTKNELHHGKSVKQAITRSGIKSTTVATRLGISRGTLYNWFDQAEIELGSLLHIAQVLNIPVAELKGVGTGQLGFEKDIYLMLKDINQKLELILNGRQSVGDHTTI